MDDQTGADRPAAAAGPGWYPDPWVASSRRYWSGSAWTSLAFPDRTVGETAGAAARAGEPNPFASASAPPATTPPPPAWIGPDAAGSTPAAETVPQHPAPSAPTGRRVWPVLASVGAVLLAVALILGFVVSRGGGANSAVAAPTPATTPPATSPASPRPTTSPTAPGQPSPQPSGPSATAPPTDPGTTGREDRQLARLGLRQSDVEPGVLVLPIDGGLQVTGQVTLDLCDATYPSEALRRARVQVAGYGLDGSTTLSTEAVRYASSDAVDQAWREIGAAAASCDTTQPGVKIDPRVGDAWPEVAGVRRLAYDLTTTGTDGQASHYVVVYLARGNVLLGVYFPNPDGPQSSVDGRTTVPGIVDVFAKRLAALPPTGVTGSAPTGVGPTA